MERRESDDRQREETIVAGQEAVDDELSGAESPHAHRKEGATAVHHESGHEEAVGREGGRTDHLVIEKGDPVPRHPQG